MSKKKYRHPPRETPPRDDRYMGLAWMYASMSKDPSTQVGAVIVSMIENRPLGFGYNGPPRQIDDLEVDWIRPDKYHLIRHAERHALDRSDPHLLKGATIYVTGRPCSICMLEIVTKAIFRVVYHSYCSDQTSMLADEEDWEKSQDIAKKGKITLDKFGGNINWIRDWNNEMYRKGVFG